MVLRRLITLNSERIWGQLQLQMSEADKMAVAASALLEPRRRIDTKCDDGEEEIKKILQVTSSFLSFKSSCFKFINSMQSDEN